MDKAWLRFISTMEICLDAPEDNIATKFIILETTATIK